MWVLPGVCLALCPSPLTPILGSLLHILPCLFSGSLSADSWACLIEAQKQALVWG